MNVEDELMDLAQNSPSKYYIMHVIDRKTNREYRVDQTLVSNYLSTEEEFTRYVHILVYLRNYFKDKSYKDIFGDRNINKMDAGDFSFVFEGVSGETAYLMLKKFANMVVNSLEAKGVLKWEAPSEPSESVITEQTKQ